MVIQITPTDSIQTAIDSIPPEGGIIELSVGTWIINAPLFITKSNITIQGQGVASIINSPSLTTDSILITNSSNVTLQNFQLIGPGNDRTAIACSSVNTSKITQLTITNYTRGNVVTLKSSNFVEISYCNIHHNGNGIGFNACYDISILNNTFDYITRGAAYAAVDSNACHRSIINNNIFRHINGPTAGVSIYTTDNAQVKNNLIELSYTGIWMYDIWNAIVEGNVIRDNGKYGITIYHDYPTGEHGAKTFIRNNKIYNNGSEGISISHSSREQYPLYNTIESNLIYNNGLNGINNSGLQHGILKNNIISNNKAYGITGNGLTISYNDIYNNSVGNYDPTVEYGIGNIYIDPQFASTIDFHLKSTLGRYDIVTQSFIYTDTVTSPCINAGDPTSNNSLSLFGGRIEIGVYGNTSEASNNQATCPIPICNINITST